MKDIFEKCETNAGYFGNFRQLEDQYYTRPVLDVLPDTNMEFQGQEQIMWSINNYLGLAGNEEVKKLAAQSIEKYSTSSPMGSRMMSGNTSAHINLEKKLAAFSQKEAAILFNFGYLGVLGTINSLLGPEDTVIMDKLSHASIVDGVFMSQAKKRVFRHNNMKDLEAVLKDVNKNRSGGVLIVVEGVYGMTGDLANLPEICALKEQNNARLFIDDAHGIGVMGEAGRGAGDYHRVQDKIDLYFGTFAKAFASIGGFTAGKKSVINWIAYNARTQVFAKSLPMVYVETLDLSLDLIIKADDRRAAMWKNSNELKKGLEDIGYYIGKGASPLCAVYLPLPKNDVRQQEALGGMMLKYLRERGIFVTAVIHPVIPPGMVMFRMIPTTKHNSADIKRTLQIFAQMHAELGISEMDLDLKKMIDTLYRIK